jgi:hypothetical protein
MVVFLSGSIEHGLLGGEVGTVPAEFLPVLGEAGEERVLVT